MDGIVDLFEWRRRRAAAGAADDSDGESPADATVARLERAIERLAPLVNGTLDAGRHLQPRVETELLAIVGELSVGLVDEATSRAERLSKRLEAAN
jgi:hypothetical protein